MSRWFAIGFCLAYFGLVVSGTAQEPFFMDVATQPSRGVTAVRALAQWHSSPDADFTYFRVKTAHGLNADLAILFDAGVHSDAEDEFERASVRGKWRWLRRDLGPLNTLRSSVLVGVERVEESSSTEPEGWNPTAGLAVTAILNRHGLNASVSSRKLTGSRRHFDREDAVDFSHLYRLFPRNYDEKTRGSLYWVDEVSGRYRDGAHWQWTSGLLYETWRWAAELGLVFPFLRDSQHFADFDWALVVGIRSLF